MIEELQIPEDPTKFQVPSFSDQNERLRLAFRERALESTFFMGKAVVGFRDMTLETHGPFCKFIDSPSRGKQGLAPRDHLKTSVWTIANTTRRVCKNPNVRILLGNETATNASHFLRRIEAIWERNVFFQWLFPELIPDWSKRPKWSETEMTVPRDQDHPESTIETIGVGGAVVSRHYDLIKLDDLVGKEASESVEVMKKTIEWYQYCESLKDHPELSEVQNYGTRWAYYDLHSWILENEIGVEVFKRKAIKEDGVPLWPERFTLETLNRIKAKIGSFKFSCQYMNEPHDPTKTTFKTEWLKYYELSDGMVKPVGAGLAVSVKDLNIYIRIDPAISEDDQACEWALVVDGVDTLGRIFLLEEWSQHCHPFVAIEKAFELWLKWNPTAFGVEAVAFQRFLKPYFEKESGNRGFYMNIVELKVDTHKSKRARMRACQPYYERGEVFIQREHRKFYEQYQQFPTGLDVDVLDAFSHGPQMWSTPLGEVNEDGLEEEERDYAIQHEGMDAETGY